MLTRTTSAHPHDRRSRLVARRLSRRALLRASGRAGVGAAGMALVGCSGDESQQIQQSQQTQPAAADSDAADQQSQPTRQAQASQSSAAQQDGPRQQADSAQQSAQQTAADEAAQDESALQRPTRGGVIRLWLPVERHDRWDPHRSRFRYTQAMHSLMYSRLVRPAAVSTGELEADLCAPPEMPDETTYIFTLDPAAAFWNLAPTNGRAVTAQDLSWNIERQRAALDAAGLPDPHFFRRQAYERTATSEATSASTLRLTTSEPDASYLASVHAAPFAWVTSPEAAELYADDWRDDPFDAARNSGSGPYTPRSYNGFELILARSDNWWRADSAWADGVIFASGDTGGIASLYAAGEFDQADFPLTNETIDALREELADHATFERPLDAGVELLAPLAGDALSPPPDDGASPLADPRVSRAVGLAIDRAALIERLYAGHGRASGPVPWYLDGWSISDALLSGFPGYGGDRAADIAEARQLIAAAGGGDQLGAAPLVVADLFEGFFAGAGETVRSMIADATGLEVELEHQPFAEAIDRLRGGDRFYFLGWGAAAQQADPSDEWARRLHSGGPEHWSDDSSAELDALIDQMRRTFNRGARQDLGHQAQELLLSGGAHQWRIPLVHGIQLGLHQPWLHPDPRLFEFAWSTQRLETSWIDASDERYPETRALPVPEPDTAGGE